jgi:hypothetical protein
MEKLIFAALIAATPLYASPVVSYTCLPQDGGFFSGAHITRSSVDNKTLTKVSVSAPELVGSSKRVFINNLKQPNSFTITGAILDTQSQEELTLTVILDQKTEHKAKLQIFGSYDLGTDLIHQRLHCSIRYLSAQSHYVTSTSNITHDDGIALKQANMSLKKRAQAACMGPFGFIEEPKRFRTNCKATICLEAHISCTPPPSNR